MKKTHINIHPNREHIHTPTTIGGRLSDAITGFVGSYWFIWLHLAWFSIWIVFHVEAFPFGLLTMIVSLEAIVLSTLVMISQNRQSARDRVRDNTEALEVDQLVKNQEELKQINLQQLAILREQASLKSGIERIARALSLPAEESGDTRPMIAVRAHARKRKEQITLHIRSDSLGEPLADLS